MMIQYPLPDTYNIESGAPRLPHNAPLLTVRRRHRNSTPSDVLNLAFPVIGTEYMLLSSWAYRIHLEPSWEREKFAPELSI